MGLDKNLVRHYLFGNLGEDGISVHVVVKIGQEGAPRRLRFSNDLCCTPGYLTSDIGDDWEVIRMRAPIPDDTCKRNKLEKTCRGPNPDLVKSATTRFGDVRESAHGGVSVAK